MMYRCSKCGHKSRTFAAMAKHARKHGYKRKAKASVTSYARAGVEANYPDWSLQQAYNAGYQDGIRDTMRR